MIDEKEINEICIQNSMRKLGIAKVATWVDTPNQEGIEYDRGICRSFWVKDAEKVFGQPPSNSIEKVVDQIFLIMKKNPETPQNVPGQAKKEEPTKMQKNKDESAIDITNSISAILPDVFSPGLLEKWSKMKTIDRMMLFQHTPPERILERPGPSGKVVKYVEGNYMVREANAAFLFDWSFDQSGFSIGTEGVAVWGILKVMIDGKYYSRPACGYEEINKKMTAQLAIKSATTDAIKKGLSFFGFNSDVYCGEV